jgi:tRNA A-37 threonylcarbamoyl transferase component Bud32
LTAFPAVITIHSRHATDWIHHVKTPSAIGRYEIIEEIGRGAMGVVYLAHDPRIDRRVAIKTIRPSPEIPFRELEDLRQRFFREAQAAGRLQHPGIVTIFDVGEDGGHLFIAMEYIEGETLEAHTTKDTLLPVDMVVHLMTQACEALDYAHQNQVIHRDIKPANLMLLPAGRLKVTDFGLAKNPASQLTQDGVLIGTPNYMSPEQVTGRALDGRSDLFSLCAVMYELLTGTKPFAGDTVTTILYRILHEVPALAHVIDPRIPPPVGRVLTRGLEKDPTQRFQSGEEMVRALRGRAVAQAMAAMAAGGGAMPMVYPGSGASTGRARLVRPPAATPRVPAPSSPPEASASDDDWETNKMPAVRTATAVADFPPAVRAGDAEGLQVAAPARTLVRNALIGVAALAIVLLLPRSAPHDDRWNGEAASAAQAAGVKAPATSPAFPPAQLPGSSTGTPGAASAHVAPGSGAAETTETVAVQFKTSPAGGRIYLDDEELPDGVAHLPRGDNAPHSVVAENDCFIEKVTWRRAQGAAFTVALKTPKVSQVPVTSTPAGAGIRLDGKPTGLSTPADVPVPVCGDHTVALALSGYKDAQAKLTGGAAEPAPVSLSLARIAAGFVSINAPYALDVLLEGKRIGAAREKIKLPAGRHTLTLRNEELFVERSLTVNIAADQTVTPAASLPALGRVTILASPSNCVISINGRELGPPPIIDQELASGTYKVRAVYVPTGEAKESTVTVPSGGSQRVPFKFTP